MKIIRKNPEKYGLQKVGAKHQLIKVLKEYDNEQDAVRDMTKLLTGEITEQELIGEKEKAGKRFIYKWTPWSSCYGVYPAISAESTIVYGSGEVEVDEKSIENCVKNITLNQLNLNLLTHRLMNDEAKEALFGYLKSQGMNFKLMSEAEICAHLLADGGYHIQGKEE